MSMSWWQDVLYALNTLRRKSWSGYKHEKCKGIISDSSIFGWNRWIGDSASREMLRIMIQSEFQNSVQKDILIDK